jgi:hypothetical protein
VVPLNRALNERKNDCTDLSRYGTERPVVFKGVTERTDPATSTGLGPATSRTRQRPQPAPA